MKKLEYISRVLLIMNEMGRDDTQSIFTQGADSTQVDRYIEGSFIDAWRRCAAVLPKSWFGKKSFKTGQHVKNLTEGTGYVVLPSDFYLLNSFKMVVWKKTVYDAYVQNDRISSIQANDFTRGSQIRPVTVLDTVEIGGAFPNVLRYYSLPKNLTNHTVEEAIYIPSVKPMSEYTIEEDIDIDPRIIEPLAYLSASTVFTIFEKYDIAKALEEKVVQMFPGFKSIKGSTVQ